MEDELGFDAEIDEDDSNEFGLLDEITDDGEFQGNWSDAMVLDIKEQPTGEQTLDPDVVRRLLEKHGMPTDNVLVDALVTIAHLRSAYGSKDSALNSHLSDLEAFLYAITAEIAQEPVNYILSLVRSVTDVGKRTKMIIALKHGLDDIFIPQQSESGDK